MAHLRRRRIVQSSAAAAPSETVLPAELRNESGLDGVQRVVIPFLVPPGDVVDPATLQLYVEGAFVPIGIDTDPATNGLPGDHVDGTPIGFMVQALYDFPDASADPREAEWRFGGAARDTASDIATVPVTAALADPEALITCQPTDAAYLCATKPTLQRLIPESQLIAAHVPLYSTYVRDALAAIRAWRATHGYPLYIFPASYDLPSLWIAAWAMTGDFAFYREALREGRGRLNDWIAAHLSTGEAAYAALDPEELGLQDAGAYPLRAEPFTQHRLGTALCYRLSGWSYFHRYGSFFAQRGFNAHPDEASAVDNRAGWIDGGNENGGYVQNPRYNLADLWCAAASARCHFSHPLFTGNGGPTAHAQHALIPHIVTAIYENRFGVAALDGEADWRAKLPGVNGDVCNAVSAGRLASTSTYVPFAVQAATSTTVTININQLDMTGGPRYLVANEFAGGPLYFRDDGGQERFIASHTGGTADIVFTLTEAFDDIPAGGGRVDAFDRLGVHPFFQDALFGEFLVMLREEIITDARVDEMIVDLADLHLANRRALEDGDIGYSASPGAHGATHGYAYACRDVPGVRQLDDGSGSYNNTGSITMPMWANVLYAAWEITGDVQYRDAGDAAARVGNVNMLPIAPDAYGDKYVPEVLGRTMDAPALRAAVARTLLPQAAPLRAIPVYSL